MKKDEKDYLGFEEIWKLCPDVIFALPGSFLFRVVAPLDLDKLDASGSGSSESLFQNTDGYFGICQVIVDLYGVVINILELQGICEVTIYGTHCALLTSPLAVPIDMILLLDDSGY